jgi:peptidyl-prolyl isomerase G (cyclophilin G)
MLQGGDFTKHNGTGGESICASLSSSLGKLPSIAKTSRLTTMGRCLSDGGTFADEDLSDPVDREGLLVMANRGKNTNGSQVRSRAGRFSISRG